MGKSGTRLGDQYRKPPASGSQSNSLSTAEVTQELAASRFRAEARKGPAGSWAGLEAARVVRERPVTLAPPRFLVGVPPPRVQVSQPGPGPWEREFPSWKGPSRPPSSAVPAGEASMERFLARLCGTSALQPLPVWEGDTTGHCFTQLALSALPHAFLAVLSACHWGHPR